jgi:MarR family transcriptional regulator, organic hydroperoxide resistance regulator
MDYSALAHEYMTILFKMRNRKNQKKITDSMHGEQFVLGYVSKHGGSVIPSEISNEMGISTARIAATLNSLQSKGLVTRRIDEKDRRRILVELTEEGQALEAEHAKNILAMLARMLEDLGEEDAVALLRILEKLSDRVPEDFFGPGHAIK